ncbi:MAG TPA: hypothetical protein VHC19_25660 [Pirellulales bacterium]|nr:hypothetical protein [Pirellulales bacterium]
MRASTAQWALVTLSMLGLSGCQTGKPSWWPGRNKVQYSSASSTPPEGASQYNMPSAQATPYGAQGDHSHGGYDPSNPGGYPADGYGANGYAVAADAAGQNAYSNAAAGGMNAGAPQTGPYDVGSSYQQATGAAPYGNAAAGGAGYGANAYQADAGAAAGAGYNAYSSGTSGYPGGAADAYGAAGQTATPYAAGQQYGDYSGQPAGGYGTPYQGGAGADPAMQNNPYGAPAAQMADSRAGAAGGQYDGAANYNAGGYQGTPETTPYGQGAAGQPPLGNTGYQPGQTGYNPGATGYNPAGVPPYQSPAGAYNPDPAAGQAEPHYRPGGTSDYAPGPGAGAGAAGAGAAGGANGYGAAGAGGYGATGAGYGSPTDGAAAGAAGSRYPDYNSSGQYSPANVGDRYATPSSPNASGANPY